MTWKKRMLRCYTRTRFYTLIKGKQMNVITDLKLTFVTVTTKKWGKQVKIIKAVDTNKTNPTVLHIPVFTYLLREKQRNVLTVLKSTLGTVTTLNWRKQMKIARAVNMEKRMLRCYSHVPVFTFSLRNKKNKCHNFGNSDYSKVKEISGNRKSSLHEKSECCCATRTLCTYRTPHTARDGLKIFIFLNYVLLLWLFWNLDMLL